MPHGLHQLGHRWKRFPGVLFIAFNCVAGLLAVGASIVYVVYDICPHVCYAVIAGAVLASLFACSPARASLPLYILITGGMLVVLSLLLSHGIQQYVTAAHEYHKILLRPYFTPPHLLNATVESAVVPLVSSHTSTGASRPPKDSEAAQSGTNADSLRGRGARPLSDSSFNTVLATSANTALPLLQVVHYSTGSYVYAPYPDADTKLTAVGLCTQVLVFTVFVLITIFFYLGLWCRAICLLFDEDDMKRNQSMISNASSLAGMEEDPSDAFRRRFAPYRSSDMDDVSRANSSRIYHMGTTRGGSSDLVTRKLSQSSQRSSGECPRHWSAIRTYQSRGDYACHLGHRDAAYPANTSLYPSRLPSCPTLGGTLGGTQHPYPATCSPDAGSHQESDDLDAYSTVSPDPENASFASGSLPPSSHRDEHLIPEPDRQTECGEGRARAQTPQRNATPLADPASSHCIKLVHLEV